MSKYKIDQFPIQSELKTQNQTKHRFRIITEEGNKRYFQWTQLWSWKNVSVCGRHHCRKGTSKWQIERRISKVFYTGHHILNPKSCHTNEKGNFYSSHSGQIGGHVPWAGQGQGAWRIRGDAQAWSRNINISMNMKCGNEMCKYKCYKSYQLFLISGRSPLARLAKLTRVSGGF